MVRRSIDESALPELSISTEKVCAIAAKAREFGGKDEVTEPDPGSNPTDDMGISILEDQPDDPVQEELIEMIRGLSDDEKVELVALAWIGRGDFGADELEQARAAAAGARNQRTAEYLCGTPLLGDYLEEGLNQLNRSCD